MKAENLAKLVIEKCVTKSNTIKVSDINMLRHIIFTPKEKKRTFKWYYGRNYKNTYSRDSDVLRKLNICFEFDNDAPKGGQNGNFIILNEKGLRKIKPFINAMKNELLEVFNQHYITRYKEPMSYVFDDKDILICVKKVANLK